MHRAVRATTRGDDVTAIVGLVHQGQVYIGGDSGGVAGWDLVIRADRKVFRNGSYIFGFTTSYRMGQLIQYGFSPPEPPEEDLHRFMVTTFVDALRDCLKSGGYQKTDNGRDEGGTFLVGVAGRLFQIQADYHVGEAADPFSACGCGANVALGALYATSTVNDPTERLTIALGAAERFSNGVRGPFAFVSSDHTPGGTS
jgi:ATP-dependent protease HslVU (ClpYQ) peptidase subunit